MFVRSSIALFVTSAKARKTIESTRHACVAFTISLLVLLSPIMIFINPGLNAAAGPISPATNADERFNTNNYHATTTRSSGASNTASSPSIALGTPTIQAPLQIPRTLQSTDLVNSLAFYEVTFITSTSGAIDRIRVDFPAGTNIAAAGVIERVGIGGGTLLKSGSSITYDLSTPVSIPAGTFIRLEMFGIKNPINPSTTFTAMITTRDSAGNLIDGPSQTNVYTIKKIVSSDLADGSVTSTKPAESLMKKVTLLDDPPGNALGWNPDGNTFDFTISEPLVTGPGTFVSIVVQFIGFVFGCVVTNMDPNIGNPNFRVSCPEAPFNGAQLEYVVQNLPPHVAQ